MNKNKIKSHETENDTEIEYVQANQYIKPKNIQIEEDKERGFTVLKIYGIIGEPEEYIEEITKLELLSNKYEVLEIILNSPGGSVSTTVDIISAISKFNYIITIGKGEVASAAFMLWSLGNVRVVTPYSMYMAHRESYIMSGKTSEHRDTAKTFGLVYDELFEECFGDLLTPEESLIAERSESWISYKDLLTRKNVISFQDYMNPTNPYAIMELFVTNNSKMFIYDKENDIFRNVTLTYGSDIIHDMTDFLYGLSNIEKIPEKGKAEKISKKTKKNKKNVKSDKDKTEKTKSEKE